MRFGGYRGIGDLVSEDLQTVAVATGPSPAALGDIVTAVVTITGDPDRKVTGAKAQLVRTALRRFTQTNVLGHGSHDSLVAEEIVVTEALMIPVGGNVTQGEHTVSLRIPPDGLPTASDQVSWSVRAVITRRHGADIKAQSPVEVLAGPDRFATEATSDIRYKGERCIDLKLTDRTLRPGLAITGTVIVRPERAVTVAQVLATFVVTRPVRKGLEGKAVAPATLLDEPADFRPGEKREFPFELTLPEDAAPSVRGSQATPPCHAIVSWDVGAHVRCAPAGEEKSGTDGFAYLGINVYNAD
jgi:hypothetical protein